MFFHSISSLFLFLPFIFITYPLIKKINIFYSNLFLLLFSLFFYSFDIPLFLIPLLISGISDYLISKSLININNNESGKKNILLFMSILVNITLLIIFKYSIILSKGFDFWVLITYQIHLKHNTSSRYKFLYISNFIIFNRFI